MPTCGFCYHTSEVATDFTFAGCDSDNALCCVDHEACGNRASAHEEQNEYRLAQREHDAASRPPVPCDGKIARFWRGQDCPDSTTCDIVYIDRTTGNEVMRYDGADPANTNAYYGAKTDSDCMASRGYNLSELIDPSQAVVKDDELARRMAVSCDDWDDGDYYDDLKNDFGDDY